MNDRVKITEHEERFLEHYVVHRKPSAAYRYGYSTAGWTPEMIAVEAGRVLKRPIVSLRLFELETVATEAFRVSIAEKKQWLKQIAEISLQTREIIPGQPEFIGDPNAAKGAINELNKMDGHLAAQKKEITGGAGGPIQILVLDPDNYKTIRQEMLDSDDC